MTASRPFNLTPLCKAVLLGGVVALASPALGAEVTADRLVNADKEPQNWLMNHRTYDGQRCVARPPGQAEHQDQLEEARP